MADTRSHLMTYGWDPQQEPPATSCHRRLPKNMSDVPVLSRWPLQSLPVGAFPDAVYDESSCVLRPGDVFVAYTDGITEGSGVHEQWGSVRLEAVLGESVHMHPAAHRFPNSEFGPDQRPGGRSTVDCVPR
jgi:hypothetical protein